MTNIYFIIISLTLIAATFNVSGVLYAICVDFYPTQVNAMALSLILTFSEFGSAVGTMVIGSLLLSYCEVLFFIIGFILCITVVLVYMLPDGKKEEKITNHPSITIY